MFSGDVQIYFSTHPRFCSLENDKVFKAKREDVFLKRLHVCFVIY